MKFRIFLFLSLIIILSFSVLYLHPYNNNTTTYNVEQINDKYVITSINKEPTLITLGNLSYKKYTLFHKSDEGNLHIGGRWY